MSLEVITCDNCKDVWTHPPKYNHCPICKVYCFCFKSRTQAVHHITDCLNKGKQTSSEERKDV